jgi:hypothetical protein
MRWERPLVRAGVLALGIALAGWFVGRGFAQFRRADRYVTVKGLAERDVEADLALWPLRLVATDNSLAQAQAAIARHTRAVLAFLARHGVDTAAAEIQGVEVTDRLAERFGGERGVGDTRFVVQQLLLVRSTDPARVHAASQRVGELIEAGIVLVSGTGYGPARPTFLFKDLNALKPAMIQEATRAARAAAEQFAADAGARVGGIRQANQGVFVILPRDQAAGIEEETQVHKTVRVVTTIEYHLQ